MMRSILILFLLIYSYESHGQELSVSGKLSTSTAKEVPYASVLIKSAANQIIAFKSSDENGDFFIKLPGGSEVRTLRLEINHLGFKKVSIPLELGRDQYEIEMEEQSIDLTEVKVSSRPRLRRIGDTLSYDVSSFAKKEDRSIGDVLKRMPGMELSESGQVKFNGQAISSLYIDGDNLLDENYTIGTKTIPYAMVKGVEVLQNHQPIKVLKNKVLSDQIAINLVIKEEAKLNLTGQAKLGVGLPHDFDLEVNSMLFNKTYKGLNVLKGNSIGIDYASEIGASLPALLLSSGTAGNPSLPSSRHLFNHASTLNANNLINQKNGLQLKFTARALLDQDNRKYQNQSAYYTGLDTILYTERQAIENQLILGEITLNGKVNKDRYYLNNVLNYTASNDHSVAELGMNHDALIDQQLRAKVHRFSNALEYVPSLKNANVIRLNWTLNYDRNPETLRIFPGINPVVFNQGEPFDGLRQMVESPSWLNDVSLGYVVAKGKVKQHYQAGFLTEFQELNSQLRIITLEQREKSLEEGKDNRLKWNRNELFVRGNYEFKSKKVEFVLSIPLTFQHIDYEDYGFALDENMNQVLMNPTFRLRYYIGQEDYFSFNYGYKNGTGNKLDVYRGTVLVNYRSLNANKGLLTEKNDHKLGLKYNFRRSISMFFMHASLSYNQSRSSSMPWIQVTDELSERVQLSMLNKVKNVEASLGMSKYIYALGATATLNASWSSTRFKQVFNDALLPYRGRNYLINPSLEARLWPQVSMRYVGTARWMTSQLISEQEKQAHAAGQVHQVEQAMELTYSPGNRLNLRVSGSHHLNKSAQQQANTYFFMDAFARYRIKGMASDIELTVRNLANVKQYESYSLSANEFVHVQYPLRGRMLMLKVIFSL